MFPEPKYMHGGKYPYAPDASPESDRTIEFGYSAYTQSFEVWQREYPDPTTECRRLLANIRDDDVDRLRDQIEALKSYGILIMHLPAKHRLPEYVYPGWFHIHGTPIVRSIIEQMK